QALKCPLRTSGRETPPPRVAGPREPAGYSVGARHASPNGSPGPGAGEGGLAHETRYQGTEVPATNLP
ncbi:MAG: hypothetical protein Q7U96_02585, partial [Chloroflexota bacterium]|nr:hypothetical protein [Chloroflexota bacterium]